jgi:hypothetical protein
MLLHVTRRKSVAHLQNVFDRQLADSDSVARVRIARRFDHVAQHRASRATCTT